eukprot:CAMPEP_0118641284 /NCGR_PEP_ID=MMETSP0785-20121206/5197_1 /TAXON_ID=91992 /ORGANISM="Bolidomonas pacifica, Strain CCMP 1866" /LENGTH=865 /DNA_ID=CAMNT_0006532713 /DNA_START=101 /DNA_END=2695 /DNA_ORIENTATION=-
MSLFRVKDFWQTKCGADEEFDGSAIAVGNVDNSKEGEGNMSIVLGSISGFLRVYSPTVNGDVRDLMVEQDLGAPILGVLIGKFIPSSSLLAVAVLHPKKLCVFGLNANEGKGGGASLDKLYEHALGVNGQHFTACNMCCGGFGGDSDRDLICVQSMDGRIQIFEQDVHAFTRRLKNVLVPGPLTYVSKIDSFVTANSKLQVECYKYTVLASSQSDGSEAFDKAPDETEVQSKRRASITAVKGVTVDWSVTVGEPVLDIKVGKFCSSERAGQVDIIVVGANCLFAISESGAIRMQKKLGYDPSSFCLYDNPSGRPGQNLIVTSFDSTMHIFREQKMIWSAKLQSVPIACFVANIDGNRGMIVTLDDEGSLSVVYLGTDPAHESPVARETKDFNYDDVDEEHRKLLGIIRASQSDTRVEPREKVVMRTQVPKALDVPGSIHDLDGGWEHILEKCVRQDDGLLKLTAKLFMTYTGTGSLKDIGITLNLPPCVMTKDTAINVETLRGGTATPMIIDLTFYANAYVLPTSNVVSVTAIFLTPSGEPRTATCDIKLPMCFFCRLQEPVKEPTYKFKLDTNRQPVMLATLFDDMFQVLGEEEARQVGGQTANYVLTFRYWVSDENGVPLNATVLLSKNAGRYRVQSHYLPALWWVSKELCERIEKFFAATEDIANSDFEMSYNEPHLPLQDFYACIDQHHWWRVQLEEKQSELNDTSHQFRTIEKRLLLRFKDRNAVPLQQLDVLMAETYHRLLEIAQSVEVAQQNVTSFGNNLSCAVRLMLLFIKLRYKLSAEEEFILSSHLSPEVMEGEGCGWEELTDLGMTDLLRTVLAKKSQEGQGNNIGNSVQVVMPKDTTKLKKHISICMDRLQKG